MKTIIMMLITALGIATGYYHGYQSGIREQKPIRLYGNGICTNQTDSCIIVYDVYRYQLYDGEIKQIAY